MATLFGASAKATVLGDFKSFDSWKVGDILSSKDEGAYLLNFYIHKSEITDIRKCFNDVSHIFAFGQNMNQSVLTIDAAIYLGEICVNKASAPSKIKIKTVSDKYDAARIYKNNKPVDVQLGSDNNFKGFVIDLTIGDVDTATQLCPVRITLLFSEAG